MQSPAAILAFQAAAHRASRSKSDRNLMGCPTDNYCYSLTQFRKRDVPCVIYCAWRLLSEAISGKNYSTRLHLREAQRRHAASATLIATGATWFKKLWSWLCITATPFIDNWVIGSADKNSSGGDFVMDCFPRHSGISTDCHHRVRGRRHRNK